MSIVSAGGSGVLARVAWILTSIWLLSPVTMTLPFASRPTRMDLSPGMRDLPSSEFVTGSGGLSGKTGLAGTWRGGPPGKAGRLWGLLR
jgi:hypothetical protein